MIVTNERGEEFELTKDEEKFYKAVERLNKRKLKQGRLLLFAGSGCSIRMDDGGISGKGGCDDTVGFFPNIRVDGGDGGDNF
jgi:hypothetical protein